MSGALSLKLYGFHGNTAAEEKKVVGRFCHCYHSDNCICNLYHVEIMALLLECGETNWITRFLKHTDFSTNERVLIVEEQKCRNIYVMPIFVTFYLVDSNLPFLVEKRFSVDPFVSRGLAALHSVAYPGFFGGWGGEVQQIQLRTEDRETGICGRQPPSQEFWRQL